MLAQDDAPLQPSWLPKMMSRNRSGLRMLAKVGAVMLMGLIGLEYLHPALQPLAATVMGGAMVAFNLIGVDCDEGLFFRSQWMNSIVGFVASTVCGPVTLMCKVRTAPTPHPSPLSRNAVVDTRSPPPHVFLSHGPIHPPHPPTPRRV